MNRGDWKSLIRKLAPTIGAALGGPLTGAAVAAVSNAVLGKPDGTEREIENALATASPDVLLKVKEAEQAFALEMEKLDIKRDDIAAMDRDSARGREIALKDKTPAVLATVITVGFFGVLIGILAYGLPDNGSEPLLLMLGALSAAWTGVISYFFGSSSGSKQKTLMMGGGK